MLQLLTVASLVGAKVAMGQQMRGALSSLSMIALQQSHFAALNLVVESSLEFLEL
jgi:hypothetical protein